MEVKSLIIGYEKQCYVVNVVIENKKYVQKPDGTFVIAWEIKVSTNCFVYYELPPCKILPKLDDLEKNIKSIPRNKITYALYAKPDSEFTSENELFLKDKIVTIIGAFKA